MDRFVSSFKKSLHKEVCRLREVSCAEDCDVTLYFCPIASRAGTDIEAALSRCSGNTASKLVLLVVIYCTIDPEKTILDSNNIIHKDNVYAVDCLFNEDDGFMICQKNTDAIKKTGKYLKSKNLTSYSCFQQEYASPLFNWDAESSHLISSPTPEPRFHFSRNLLIVFAVLLVIVAVIITIFLFVWKK